MPCWIVICHWIINCICISIPVLRLKLIRDDTVRLGESSQGGVVPAGVVEHQAEICGIAVLSRVGVVCLLCSRLMPDFPPSFVHGLADHKSAGAGDKGCAPQVVTEDEVQRVVLPHRDSLSPCIVILRDNPIGHFVVIAHKVCGRNSCIGGQHRFHPPPITVIDEGRLRENSSQWSGVQDS